MKKYVIILFLFLTQSLIGQKKFSFLDCVTVSMSGNYVFNYNRSIGSEKVSINNYYVGNKEENTVRVKNYFSYSFEAKYYLKAYRNVRIGLGMEYTMRKAFFEYVTTPKSIGYPIVLVKYEKNHHLYGPSGSLSYSIPKWKLRLTVFQTWLYLKNRRLEQDESQYYYFSRVQNGNQYLDGYKLGIVDIDEVPIERKTLPLALVAWGAEIQYRLGKKVYLQFQLRRMGDGFHFGVEHRYYENVDGVEQEYEVGTAGISGGARHQVGIGVAYHFFEKD